MPNIVTACCQSNSPRSSSLGAALSTRVALAPPRCVRRLCPSGPRLPLVRGADFAHVQDRRSATKRRLILRDHVELVSTVMLGVTEDADAFDVVASRWRRVLSQPRYKVTFPCGFTAAQKRGVGHDTDAYP